MRIIAYLFIMILVRAGSSAQTSYYVAPAGNDTSAGTFTQPWKTFQKACNAATPGSNVYFMQGIYNEKVTLNASGTAEGGYITFQPYEDDTVILDGTGKTGDQLILIENKSYVRLQGFELRNNLNQTFGTGIWVKGGGSHIEIRNNTIHDMRRSGAGDCMAISIYGTSNTPLSHVVIDSNVIYDCEPGHSEALTLNGNVDTFQVTNNTVHDVNNIGIDMIGGEGTCSTPLLDAVRNGVCRGNVVYNAHSLYGGGYAAGIYVDGGINITVENNMSYSNDVGIEIGCENNGRVSSGMIVRNNLVFNNDKRGIGIGGYDFPATGKVTTSSVLNNTCFNNDTEGTGEGELTIEYTEDCMFNNNIFYSSNNNKLMITTVGNGSGNQFDYNLWYAPGGISSTTIDYNGTVYTGFAAYQSGTGQDAHSLFANPSFVSASLPIPDLHLQPGSPALDAGDPAFVPDSNETDYEGNERILGARVDCGAYEKNQIIVTTPLLLEPVNGASVTTSPVMLRWTASDSGATYHLQVATDSLFTSLLTNDSLLSDTTAQVVKTVNGTYYWHVRASISGVYSSWSAGNHFIFTSSNRWKIVSVPLSVADGRTTLLYPTAISSAFAFIPDAGYMIQDTLKNGSGYWLKFGADQSTNIAGDSIFADTIDVSEGWNLLGSISIPVEAASLTTEPLELFSSNFFGYENGYIVADMIEPGKGYWVKAKQAGRVILR